ncbi:MAG: DUF2442 domain-containing protein [Gemmatimonadota bacterium]|nr:DUF2442 domain-containing protein [Gemmatimonadota bacterium]
MIRHHDVSDLHFDGDEMVLTIDGRVRRFKIRDISSVLLNATSRERNTYEVSPSGYGVHWPLIDEDLSIDGLPGITHGKRAAKLA